MFATCHVFVGSILMVGMVHVIMRHMLPPFNFFCLEPCNVNDVHAHVEFVFELETNRKALVTILEIGNHFAVVVDEGHNERFDFWIFICEEPFHAMEEERKVDNWGQVLYRGKQIVIGRYYKQ